MSRYYMSFSLIHKCPAGTNSSVVIDKWRISAVYGYVLKSYKCMIAQENERAGQRREEKQPKSSDCSLSLLESQAHKRCGGFAKKHRQLEWIWSLHKWQSLQ